MTDIEKRAHDIAMVVTEMYIENDLQVSRAKNDISGKGTANIKPISSSLLAESFILRYNIVYQQLLDVLKNSDLEVN